MVTNFDYDLLGQLAKIDYSDATPDVTWSLPDSKGRYTKIEDGAGARIISRPAVAGGETIVETLTPTASDGVAEIVSIIEKDAFGRMALMAASATNSAGGATELLEQTYSYGADGRLQGTDESTTGVAAVYNRAANSEFVNETVTYEGTLAGAIAGTAPERQRFTRAHRRGSRRVVGGVFATQRPLPVDPQLLL